MQDANECEKEYLAFQHGNIIVTIDHHDIIKSDASDRIYS